MSLIKCPECGKEISSFAEFCPHCGCPKLMINNTSITNKNYYYESNTFDNGWKGKEILPYCVTKGDSIEVSNWKSEFKDIDLYLPDGFEQFLFTEYENLETGEMKSCFFNKLFIPKSYKTIIIENAYKLEELYISSGVEHLKISGEKYINRLKKVFLPDSIQTIWLPRSVEMVFIDRKNKYLEMRDGVLVEKRQIKDTNQYAIKWIDPKIKKLIVGADIDNILWAHDKLTLILKSPIGKNVEYYDPRLDGTESLSVCEKVIIDYPLENFGILQLWNVTVADGSFVEFRSALLEKSEWDLIPNFLKEPFLSKDNFKQFIEFNTNDFPTLRRVPTFYRYEITSLLDLYFIMLFAKPIRRHHTKWYVSRSNGIQIDYLGEFKSDCFNFSSDTIEEIESEVRKLLIKAFFSFMEIVKNFSIEFANRELRNKWLVLYGYFEASELNCEWRDINKCISLYDDEYWYAVYAEFRDNDSKVVTFKYCKETRGYSSSSDRLLYY